MIFALFTVLCWSFSGFSSSRVARSFGSAGNGLRLLLSTGVLLGICLLFRLPLTFPGQAWFMLAGVLHLALGDIGLFAVYRRLGPRIGVLMTASLSTAVALIGEWLLLGTVLRPLQLVVIVGIIALVLLAVAPRERNHLSPRELKIGILAGLFSAAMQGSAAVVNRYAYTLHDLDISPWTATLHRVGAGAAGVGCWLIWLQLRGQRPLRRPGEMLPDKKVPGHPALWMSISVLLGPVLGIAFLMKAFETTSSGLVQAVISTLPVFMIPVAWWLDGSVPSRRSVIAGGGAVALTVWLITF